VSLTPEQRERAQALGWYHALELGPEFLTPGMFDMRRYIGEYGLPERMDGMRVLEVGTWDGFWSFEMERRGAEVWAIDLDEERDLDWPPRRRPQTWPEQVRGEGFALAREVFGSKVRRVVRSVYDASPEELGTFDLVFCGAVIIHLRDQLLALERIAALCSGTFISAEEYDPWLSRIPLALSRYRADRDQAVVYWTPNIRCWRRMLWTAGFDRVEEHNRFTLHSDRDNFDVRMIVFHASKDQTQRARPPATSPVGTETRASG